VPDSFIAELIAELAEQGILLTPDGRMPAADAAKYIHDKPKTLAMYRTYGGGPPFLKLGRIWYFKQDLDDWIRSRRVTTTAELDAKKRTGEVATSYIPRRLDGPSPTRLSSRTGEVATPQIPRAKASAGTRRKKGELPRSGARKKASVGPEAKSTHRTSSGRKPAPRRPRLA
jgi:hypothetical protein